jgi:hypothetical protein
VRLSCGVCRYEGESLQELLEEIERAHTVLLDRWRITITRTQHRDADEKEVDSLDLAEELPGETLQKIYIANNYFSVGTHGLPHLHISRIPDAPF